MVDSRFDGDNRVDESAIEDWFTAPPSPDSGNTDDAPADPADGVGRTAFSVVEGGNGLEDANAEEDDWFDVTSPILGARPETEPMPHQQGGSEWSDTDSTMGKPWPSDPAADGVGPDSWVVDQHRGDTAARAADETGRSWLSRHRTAVAVGGSITAAVAVLAGVAATAVAAFSAPDNPLPISAVITASSTVAVTPSPAQAAADGVRPWCFGFTGGEPIDGSSPDAGEAAIARFQAAYYVDRDAAKARSFVAEGAVVGTVEQMTEALATLAPGTEHCLLASARGGGAYVVDLFVRPPGGASAHYPQNVATTPGPNGGALITAITVRTGE